ncbi:transmembrane protein 235 [Latimeria chalumnae]|uniref:transmembrane protein 235 n=1 Tax=Latimeria chalumnae TaxID=7897 RepID=UPI0003C10EC1|nr:PREDICTED: transmembrane protein 235 [Latimeria chalumnae]|eukprot:XP_005989152.1 PREDICTED: transmembrane protein 235 [Latimeria chalumnae]
MALLEQPKLGALFLVVGCAGILSFTFLTVAIGSDYWYIVEVNPNANTSLPPQELDSHSGLWRYCEGKNGCISLIDPFGEETLEVPDSQQHLIRMHLTFVILLPLSLILLVFGAICGLVSSLAKSFCLLLFTGCYFFVVGLLTLSGISLYIGYSKAAFVQAVEMYDHERFKNVHISFGWSMGLAWLSFSMDIIAGSLLLLAAKIVNLQHVMQSAEI